MQYLVLWTAGQHPEFVIVPLSPEHIASPDDQATGVYSGVSLAVILLVGNVINSFMEEGLFRGITLRHFRISLSFWQANVLQAILFGAWHVVWPIRSYTLGVIGPDELVVDSALTFLTTAAAGLMFGYLFLKTSTLWIPWFVHTINNTIFNFVHIRTVVGLDADLGVLVGTVTIGYVMLMGLTWLVAQRGDLQEVQPWGVVQLFHGP